MIGIGKIIQQGIKYTAKGSSLVRKELGLSTRNFVQEGYKGIKIPKGAVSYDAVKVGRNFNADDFFTDIFTFRDKDGNILQRLTNKVDGKDNKQTLKWYEKLFEHDIALDDYGDNVVFVNAIKVSGYERENGRISHFWNEVVTKTDEANPKFTIFKRISNGDQETHYLAQLEKGKKPKFIENIYNLFVAQPLSGKRIRGIGEYKLASFKVSDEALREIAEHPYAFPAMSKYNKFINRMFGAIDKDANAILSPELKLFKAASRKGGYYSAYEGFAGTIHINKLDNYGNLRSRDDLTRTIAHEYGHHQWKEKAMSLEVFDDELMFPEEELPLVKEYLKSINKYVSFDKDAKAYYEQFSERVARVEGREAVKKISDLNRKIEKEFPYCHAEQFYDISKEGNESVNDFAILLDMAGETKKDLYKPKEADTYKMFADLS